MIFLYYSIFRKFLSDFLTRSLCAVRIAWLVGSATTGTDFKASHFGDWEI
jgi:hypothetical protein